jgi:hypothetical protein
MATEKGLCLKPNPGQNTVLFFNFISTIVSMVFSPYAGLAQAQTAARLILTYF